MDLLWAWLILSALGAALTTWWSLRLWRRRQDLTRGTRILALGAAAAATSGALGTVLGVVKAFGAVGGESVDPSQKARILAEDISGAANFTALGIIVWIPSAIALAVATRKRRQRST